MKILPKTLLPFVWYFIQPHWGKFLLLMLTTLGWSLQESVYPYFIKLLVDQVPQYSTHKAMLFSGLAPTLLAFLALWLAIEVAFRVYDFLSAKVLPTFRAQVRGALFEYALQHSYEYYANNFAGSIANKIARLPDALERIINIIATIMAPIVVAFLINIVFLYHAKPLFAYIMGIWFILHFSITYFFTCKCAVYAKKHSESVTTVNGKVVDILSNMVNVRLFAHQRFEKRYFGKFQKEEVKKAYELMRYNAWMKVFLGLASQTFIFSMIGGGLYAWQQDWITLGELTLVLSSLNLLGLAWYMGMHLIEVYQNVGTCQEALSIVQAMPDIVDAPGAKPIRITQGEIRFEQVNFGYNSGKKIFRNKTVTLAPGERVGLVGFSGSGKSTFANLILRYFEVESGRICIDNQDIHCVTQDSLREQIALIPQDTSLFHRTLLENIRYGRSDASDAEVIKAARKAHCHEFIEQLPDGYQTLAGERGVKLSGGQRQRIAIARAILKNAPILILDEATSALDSVTENYIQESLKALMLNRTVIVIAHRLSTLSDMNRILVFQNGEIIEDGKHVKLLKNDGHYAALWKRQSDGFLPDSPDV